MSLREAERARRFQTNRRQTRQLTNGNITLELAQVFTALNHYRTKLATALEKNDRPIVDQCLNQLITLRSTQCALNLKRYQETGQPVTPALIKAERAAYYADCAKLVALSAV